MKYFCLLCLFVLFSGPIFAQGNEEAALEKINQGKEAYDAGNYKKAQTLLEDAQKLFGGPELRVQPLLIRTLVSLQNWPQANIEINNYFGLPNLDAENADYKELVNVRTLVNNELAADDTYYNYVAKKDPVKYFDEYKKKYPYGKHLTELRLSKNAGKDDGAWKKAESFNTQSSYEAYMDKFPNGAHIAEAKKAIIALDNSAWTKAQKTNSSNAYKDYIDNYPEGKHLQEAKAKQAEKLEDEAYDKGASKQDVDAYEAYLKVYPDGRYKTQADQWLQKKYMEQADAWVKEKNYDDAADYYKRYITRYPHGPVAEEAGHKYRKYDYKARMNNKPDLIFASIGFDTKKAVGIGLNTLRNPQFGWYFAVRFNADVLAGPTAEYTLSTVNNQLVPSTSAYKRPKVTGAVQNGRLDLVLGFTKRIVWPLWMYAGAGIGDYPVLWGVSEHDSTGKQTNTQKVTSKNTDLSYFHYSLEGGLIYAFKPFAIKVGYFYNFRESYVTAGIGIAIPYKKNEYEEAAKK